MRELARSSRLTDINAYDDTYSARPLLGITVSRSLRSESANVATFPHQFARPFGRDFLISLDLLFPRRARLPPAARFALPGLASQQIAPLGHQEVASERAHWCGTVPHHSAATTWYSQRLRHPAVSDTRLRSILAFD